MLRMEARKGGRSHLSPNDSIERLYRRSISDFGVERKI